MLLEIKENKLNIQVHEDDTSLKIKWYGKSMDREPALFLSPFLSKVIALSEKSHKTMEMDFTALDYMNSSTITPIVQMLDDVKEREGSMIILYNKNKSWQEVNFTALKFFESTEPLIKVQAV